MRIKRLPILFQNVLGMKVTCSQEEWYAYAQSIRNNVILNDLYAIGPISFQVEETNEELDEIKITFYQPVSEELHVDNEDEFFYQKELYFEDGLLVRCVDLDEIEEMYELLDLASKELKVKLQQPYLHIYLNVYGEGMMDIFAPIVKENSCD